MTALGIMVGVAVVTSAVATIAVVVADVWRRRARDLTLRLIDADARAHRLAGVVAEIEAAAEAAARARATIAAERQEADRADQDNHAEIDRLGGAALAAAADAALGVDALRGVDADKPRRRRPVRRRPAT